MTPPTVNPTFKGPVEARKPNTAPRLGGPLFPKTDAAIDPMLKEARALLSALVGSENAFRLGTTARAKNEHRAFGVYPDEPLPVPAAAALEGLKSALTNAHRLLSTGVASEDTTANLYNALGLIHSPVAHAADANLVAPLHAFLPDETHIDTLAHVSFAHAIAEHANNDQRSVLHYLSLLQEVLEKENERAGPKDSDRARKIRRYRMLTHINKGEALARSHTIQQAIGQYEKSLEINDLYQEDIRLARLYTHLRLIDLRWLRLKKLHGENKKNRTMIEVGEIKKLLDSIEGKVPVTTEPFRAALIELRQNLARAFWSIGLLKSAHDVLHGIQSEYASDEGRATLKTLLAATSLSDAKQKRLYAHLTNDDGSLKHPEKVRELKLSAPAWTWISQTLKNAKRSAPIKTIVRLVGGAAITSGAVLAATGGDASPTTVLAATGAGAAAVDLGFQILNGARSPQTKEAVALGLTDVSPTSALKHAAGVSLKTLVPYLAFGGHFPLMGALSDAPLVGSLFHAAPDSALAAGSFGGPGAIVAGGLAAAGSESSLLIRSVAERGLSEGMSAYGVHLGRTTLGSTVVAAGSAYSDFVSSIVDGRLGDKIGGWASRAAHAGGWEQALIGYQAATAAYFGAYRFSSTLRENARFNRAGKYFVPGGILLGANLGVALGGHPGYGSVGAVELPWNMMGVATVGAAYQTLGQTLAGKKSFGQIAWGNLIASALVINTYVGASANFNPLVHSETFGQMAAESVGRQLSLSPLFGLHYFLHLADLKRFAQGKAARLAFYDHAGNMLRIWTGAWDGALPVLVGVTTNFFVTNTLLNRTVNELAGSRPAAQNLGSMLQRAAGSADNGVLNALRRGLLRIHPVGPMKNMKPVEIAKTPFTAFWDSMRGNRLGVPMLVEEKTARMIYEGLMTDERGSGYNRTQVKTLLHAAERFLAHDKDVDIAKILAHILWRARSGSHGQQIESFFLGKHRHVFDKLAIDRNATALPKNRGAQERELLEELQYLYRTFPREVTAREIGQMDHVPTYLGRSPNAFSLAPHATFPYDGTGLPRGEAPGVMAAEDFTLNPALAGQALHQSGAPLASLMTNAGLAAAMPAMMARTALLR